MIGVIMATNPSQNRCFQASLHGDKGHIVWHGEQVSTTTAKKVAVQSEPASVLQAPRRNPGVRRDLLIASAEGTWRHESVRTQIWEEERKMRAADVMTTDVVTVGPDACVVEVAETLLASRIGAVPLSESGVSWSGS
jgi:CBS domain-containing protein